MPGSYAHIRQIVWVQSGEPVLVRRRRRHELKAGDSLGFGPPSEVTYANESSAALPLCLSRWRGAEHGLEALRYSVWREQGDLGALTDIYNHYVRETAVTFDVEPRTLGAAASLAG